MILKYDWILFDADNTIFDFHASSEIAFHNSFAGKGIHAEDEWYKIFLRINLETWKAYDENKLTHEEIKKIRFSRLFEQIEINHLDPLEFNAIYFRNLVENPKYVPGAIALLDHLTGKVKLGLITNGMKEVQRPRLVGSGMIRYFDMLAISGEIGHSKPNHSFFEFVHNKIGWVSKGNVLVVGDNLVADIKGGNEYGFDTAWYNPAGIPVNNGVRPDYEIAAMPDLISVL